MFISVISISFLSEILQEDLVGTETNCLAYFESFSNLCLVASNANILRRWRDILRTALDQIILKYSHDNDVVTAEINEFAPNSGKNPPKIKIYSHNDSRTLNEAMTAL